MRCPWALNDPLLERYHDLEWGVPLFDPRTTFEFLVLETFQAGLSWRVVLAKREAFRRAFAGFDVAAVARFGEVQVAEMLSDPSLIRHRGKIEAAIVNARCVLDLEERGPGLVEHFWSFVGGGPIVHRFALPEEVPTFTVEAQAMAGDLRRRGFRFVGPTTLYAHMQATGMVNDHLTTCPRHAELAAT